METCAVARRMSALILVITVSVIGMPLPAGAAGEEDVEVAWHRALTFNGRPLSQFLGAATPRRAAFPLAAFLRQESGLILGVALHAEGQPLADHAVELWSLSERATAPPVVATTTTASLTVQPPWNWQPRHDSAGWCGRIFREPATPPQIQTVLVGHVSH